MAKQVLFTGSVPYQHVVTWMQAADVGILPLMESNIRQRNGCITLKLWDRMASGLPVVATDLPDTKSYPLLKDYVMQVPSGNAEAMTGAVVQLFDNPALRQALAESSRQYAVSHRTWHHAARETGAFLHGRLSAMRKAGE